MNFYTINKVDIVNTLVLIEALEKGITTEFVNIYDYLNLTDEELLLFFNEKVNNIEVNI